MLLDYQYNDGGRSAAGFKGQTGDCVVRAIAIACELDYGDCYRELRRRMRPTGRTPRHGVPRAVYDDFLADLGWRWVPTMRIGAGCTTHLRASDLPQGEIVVRLSRHLLAVVDHTMQDIYRDDRDGTRCVYGYWEKK
jgi:hypothetical protein